MSAASKLDTEKFRKVHGLMTGGATAGERSAAKARAEAMAVKAGMSLKDAVSSLDSKPKPQPANFFDGFEDWCEEREPGYKAKRTAEKAEREARNAIRRSEILAQYGSKKALFARTPHEVALDASIAHLATWSYWTEDDGTQHRYAETLDGRKGTASWRGDAITPAVKDAVLAAYPWPSDLAGALREMKDWDQLSRDRALFSGGEWNHYVEVEARIFLLEDALEQGQPATNWDDVQARFGWKRFQFESQWTTPQELNDPFLDRLEADLAILRDLSAPELGSAEAAPLARASLQPIPLPRTNAEKRAAILSMLDIHPDLSDREIGRRLGISPQTVNTWRKKGQAS